MMVGKQASRNLLLQRVTDYKLSIHIDFQVLNMKGHAIWHPIKLKLGIP